MSRVYRVSSIKRPMGIVAMARPYTASIALHGDFWCKGPDETRDCCSKTSYIRKSGKRRGWFRVCYSIDEINGELKLFQEPRLAFRVALREKYPFGYDRQTGR